MDLGIDSYLQTFGSGSPTVTNVAVQAKRRDRVSVFVDGEFAFGVADEVAMRHGLRKGVSLDENLLKAVYLDEAVTTCKRVAVRFISYRMRSEAEVRSRLGKEGASPDAIDAALDHLRQVGLVDDASFAEAFGRDAVLGKSWGPHRIAQGLRRAGIGEAHIGETLAKVRHTVEDEDVIGKAARKRWEQLSRVKDAQRRKKSLYDYLARRGFDFDDIRRVMAEVCRA